jgi:hypothetical protein
VKVIFMPLIVTNRAHLERRFAHLELLAERSEMLPGFSLLLSRVEETTRGIVELGLPETHITGKALFGSGPHRWAL